MGPAREALRKGMGGFLMRAGRGLNAMAARSGHGAGKFFGGAASGLWGSSRAGRSAFMRLNDKAGDLAVRRFPARGTHASAPGLGRVANDFQSGEGRKMGRSMFAGLKNRVYNRGYRFGSKIGSGSVYAGAGAAGLGAAAIPAGAGYYAGQRLQRSEAADALQKGMFGSFGRSAMGFGRRVMMPLRVATYGLAAGGGVLAGWKASRKPRMPGASGGFGYRARRDPFTSSTPSY